MWIERIARRRTNERPQIDLFTRRPASLRHNRAPRSELSAIDRSMTSLPRKKSVEMMLAWRRQWLFNRLVTILLTASALARSDPRSNSISRTVGVVCAIAENNGDSAWGCGDEVIASSKYSNKRAGLFVFAQRWGRIGHSHLFSEKEK